MHLWLAYPFLIPVAIFLLLWGLIYLPLAGVGRLLVGAARKGGEWVVQSRVGKWAGSRRGWHGVRPYLPLALVLLGGAILATLAAHVFVELSEDFQLPNSTVYHADRAAHDWFFQERQAGITSTLRAITFFGGGPGIALITGLASLVLLYFKKRATAAYLAGTAIGGIVLNSGLKLWFARTRPDLASAAVVAHWYSFPSGHAMESFIVYGALAYITLRQPWPWKVDSAVLALVLTMVVLIGLSRVYLGVHWVSDIAGGWSAGAVWLVTATVAFDMVLRLKRRRGA